MAAANREAVAVRASPVAAKRGRLSERVWVDVVRAARVVALVTAAQAGRGSHNTQLTMVTRWGDM